MTEELKIDFAFACRDDCLDRMVPSDLRALVKERDALRAQLTSQGGEAVEVFAYGSSDGYQPVLPRQSIGSNGERISCYDKPLMTVAQHKRLMLALAIRCEQKGAFKTCMECGYQDGHDMICQYHESKRANQRLEEVVKRLREALDEVARLNPSPVSAGGVDERAAFAGQLQAATRVA